MRKTCIILFLLLISISGSPLAISQDFVLDVGAEEDTHQFDKTVSFNNQLFANHIQELDDSYHTDYICGGNSQYIIGDDCSIDQNIVKGLYKYTVDTGTMFDKRVITLYNTGLPHNVEIDAYLCYKKPVSVNMLGCHKFADRLEDEKHAYHEFNAEFAQDYYIYLRAWEGSKGDQTSFQIKIESVANFNSNQDYLEPRTLVPNSEYNQFVCQHDCEHEGDIDYIDAYEFTFFKGDSFSVEFWSSECEPSSGNVNYQIAAELIIWRPSSLDPEINKWRLNEQDCGRDDGYSFIEVTDAYESGQILLIFKATSNHGDEDAAGYSVRLINHDTSMRVISHDEDGDGYSDLDEYVCESNYWYSSAIPLDTDGDSYCDSIDLDDDDDGVSDNLDMFPKDPEEWQDNDLDNIGDNADPDDDNDNWSDSDEINCSTNPRSSTDLPQDFDDDKLCDKVDLDDDNDGWDDDREDECDSDPMNTNEFPLDTDNDDICDYRDVDDDGDGLPDSSDDFPNDPNEWIDSDGDGVGNNADLDDDGDGFNDSRDAFPLDFTQQTDFDGDGCGDNSSGTNGDKFPDEVTQCYDSDGDGFGDNQSGNFRDAFPYNPTQWNDFDGDGFGDNPNGTNPDQFPLDSTQWNDDDGDGYGDNINGNSPDLFPKDGTQHNDSDGDGFGDNFNGLNPDYCPLIYGLSFKDVYGCVDGDNDGWSNMGDDCPENQGYSQFDRKGCIDSDNDGFSDPDSNSFKHPNGLSDAFPFDETQSRDLDGDGFGDNASGNNNDDCMTKYGNSTMKLLGCPDDDGDGWPNTLDSFPTNPTQVTDTDSDGFGDNSAGMNGDLCPNTPAKTAFGCPDKDNDGIPNEIDLCDSSRNQIQNIENTCFSAIIDRNGAGLLSGQGSMLISFIPMLSGLIVWIRFKKLDV